MFATLGHIFRPWAKFQPLEANCIRPLCKFKGTVSRDFRLLVFYESVSPKPLSIPLGHVSNFFENFSEIFAAQVASPVSLTPVANWKNLKVLIILFGHLWEVELTYRYIFAFKFTLRSQQPDTVPIICQQYQQDL